MSVAKVIEISASSKESFDDAVEQGIARATKSVKDVKSAWIKEQSVYIKNGKIKEYRVLMKVTFVLKE